MAAMTRVSPWIQNTWISGGCVWQAADTARVGYAASERADSIRNGLLVQSADHPRWPGCTQCSGRRWGSRENLRRRSRPPHLPAWIPRTCRRQNFASCSMAAARVCLHRTRDDRQRRLVSCRHSVGGRYVNSYMKLIDTDVKHILLFIACNIFMLLISDVVIVVRPLFICNIKTLTLRLVLRQKKRLLYRNQTSLRHLLRNKLNM